MNAEHVSKLLKNNLKLSDNGSVEVVDAQGETRFSDATGEAMSVDELVNEFLDANPYFKAAQPAGAGSTGSGAKVADRELSLEDLDLTNPKHREIYRQLRLANKL